MLNKLKASQLKSNEPRKLYDGGGLYLVVKAGAKGGARKNWIYRFRLAGRSAEMGLGSLGDVSLQQARAQRDRWAASVKGGHDPRQIRDSERDAASKAALGISDTPTLSAMIEATYQAVRADLKSDRSSRSWKAPLDKHVIPTIGDTPVDQITQHLLRDTFKTLWHEKHPTALKVMMRIGMALEHAAAADLDVDLMAVKKAKLLMGSADHVAKKQPAIDYRDAPAFFQQLPDLGASLPLKVITLCGVRSAEIRLAKIENIDWESGILTTPAELVKGRKKAVTDNRIALTSEAVRLLRWGAGARSEGYVFLNSLKRPYTDNLSKAFRDSQWLKDRGIKATPHGMRSAAKSYLLDNHPEVPPHVVELVLSHKTENRVGEAYTRTDMLDLQRCALERWSRYLTGDTQPVIDKFSPDGVIAKLD